MIEERTEEYLKTIGQAAESGEIVTTSLLAQRLGVSMPSVTEMLQRLSGKGLVYHAPRGRAQLTSKGERQARSLIRRHRLWESFLVRFLGFTWDEVHEEAGRLEHVTSPALEERLADFLGDMTTCPHGHAIPGRSVGEPEVVSLSAFDAPGLARVVRIRQETPDFLRRLARLDMRPGRVIEVERIDPRDGSIWVRMEGWPKEVMADLAAAVMVQRTEESERLSSNEEPSDEGN